MVTTFVTHHTTIARLYNKSIATGSEVNRIQLEKHNVIIRRKDIQNALFHLRDRNTAAVGISMKFNAGMKVFSRMLTILSNVQFFTDDYSHVHTF